MDEGVEGVFYLSGDVHWCRIDEHSASVTDGYPIYEVISSGITRGEDRGFARLTFDIAAPDPQVRVRIIYGDATIRDDKVIRLSELTLPTSDE